MEPATHEAASGACNEVTMIPLEFYAYGDAFCDKEEAEPVRDRWIYVFKKLSWGTRLYAELFIDDDGVTKLVNWRGREWVGEDERPADVERDAFEVAYRPAQYDLMCFLSHKQIARERIETYTGSSGLEPVIRRCMHFDPSGSDVEPLGEDCAGCRVYLTDHLQVAQRRHELYEEALDSYAEFLDDDRATLRQLLATLALNVAESIEDEEEEVWEWFDRDEVQREIDDYGSRREEKEDRIDRRGRWLSSWMRRPAYREMLLDYTGTEALEDKGHDLQADLCEGLSQSEPGRDFLDEVLQGQDSWHNQVVVPAGDYLFGQARRAVGATGKGLKLFQEFAASMAARSLNETGSFVRAFFELRFGTRVSFYKTIRGGGGGLRQVSVTYSQFVEGGAISRGIDVAETSERVQRVAASGEVNVQRLAGVLNVINLALAGKSVADAEGTQDQALAVTALMGAIADVTSSVTNLMAASRNVKIVGGSATIVGGVLSYGGSVYKIATRSPDENAGVVAGLSLAALGGAFSAAAGVSALTGSLFIVFGSTGIGLIGVGLAVLGAGLIYHFKESPLEQWFKQCPWGVDAASRPVRNHLDDLFEILAGFNVQCDILETVPEQAVAHGSSFEANYAIRFRIFPGLYYPDRSVFRVRGLTLGGNNIADFTIEAPENHYEYDDGSTLYVTRYGDRIHEISRVWGLSRRPGSASNTDYSYDVELDLHGDDQFVYEDEGEGSMEIVPSHAE